MDSAAWKASFRDPESMTSPSAKNKHFMLRYPTLHQQCPPHRQCDSTRKDHTAEGEGGGGRGDATRPPFIVGNCPSTKSGKQLAFLVGTSTTWRSKQAQPSQDATLRPSAALTGSFPPNSGTCVLSPHHHQNLNYPPTTLVCNPPTTERKLITIIMIAHN